MVPAGEVLICNLPPAALLTRSANWLKLSMKVLDAGQLACIVSVLGACAWARIPCRAPASNSAPPIATRIDPLFGFGMIFLLSQPMLHLIYSIRTRLRARSRHGRARRHPQSLAAPARIPQAVPGADPSAVQRPGPYRRDLRRRAVGHRLVRVAPAGRDLGVAAGDSGVLLLQPVRMVDPEARDAPARRRVLPARDL